MKKLMLFVFGVVIFMSSNSFVFAETLVLKSGQRLEGKIIEKTDKYIKINFEGVTVNYDVDEIASIEGEGAPAAVDKVAAESPTNALNLENYTTKLDQCILNGKYEEANY